MAPNVIESGPARRHPVGQPLPKRGPHMTVSPNARVTELVIYPMIEQGHQ